MSSPGNHNQSPRNRIIPATIGATILFLCSVPEATFASYQTSAPTVGKIICTSTVAAVLSPSDPAVYGVRVEVTVERNAPYAYDQLFFTVDPTASKPLEDRKGGPLDGTYLYDARTDTHAIGDTHQITPAVLSPEGNVLTKCPAKIVVVR